MALAKPVHQLFLSGSSGGLRGGYIRLPAVVHEIRKPWLFTLLRSASTSKPIPKPMPQTLAKPDRFNPPSHPSRLVKSAPIRQYGPRITEEEKVEHQTKQYPHMPPPKGSFMDRFLNNKALHMSITLGILLFFAGWTLMLDFKVNSPFAGMMPSGSDWLHHPFEALGTWWNIIKSNTLYESERAAKSRAWSLNETFKTKAYRVMHGLEPLAGQPTEVQILVAKMRGEYIETSPGVFEVKLPDPPPKKPVKKWLGIW